MNTIWKKISRCLLSLFVLCSTGCIERLSLDDLPSENEMLDYVSNQVEEPYTYVSSQVDDDNLGITYTFQSDRGFTFHAQSHISQGFLTSDTIKKSNDYDRAVRSLYVNQVNAVFQTNPILKDYLFDSKYFVESVNIGSYEDLEIIMSACDELYEIWKGELEQYSHSFSLINFRVQ